MIEIAVALYVLAGIILVVRLILGPTFADRAIVSDAITNIVTLFLVAYSVSIRNPMYLDVAIIFAMMSFVGVLAIAKYGVKNNDI